jgi:hypothetical protein
MSNVLLDNSFFYGLQSEDKKVKRFIPVYLFSLFDSYLQITDCYFGLKTTSPNLVVTFMPIFFKN